MSLLAWAPRKQLSYPFRECLLVPRILALTPFSRALPSKSTSVGIGQALSFGPGERLVFDQDTLAFVALARTAKANHYRSERRVAAGPSSERRITASKKHQVIQIGASKAKRPLSLHSKKAALAKLLPTLVTGRVTNDPENNDLVASRRLAGNAAGSHEGSASIHQ